MSEYDRLRWDCRRGMLELDLLLNGFLEREGDRLGPQETAAFKALLAYPDQELFDMVMGRADPPAGPVREVLDRVRAA